LNTIDAPQLGHATGLTIWLAKLGCHDRAQLVVVAYETGLVTPGARDEDASSDAA
jgi:hypothetical protein